MTLHNYEKIFMFFYDDKRKDSFTQTVLLLMICSYYRAMVLVARVPSR